MDGLDYVHGGRSFGPIYGWLVEHEVDSGRSEGPATHALILDRQTGRAGVAPRALAERLVRGQYLPASAPED